MANYIAEIYIMPGLMDELATREKKERMMELVLYFSVSFFPLLFLFLFYHHPATQDLLPVCTSRQFSVLFPFRGCRKSSMDIGTKKKTHDVLILLRAHEEF